MDAHKMRAKVPKYYICNAYYAFSITTSSPDLVKNSFPFSEKFWKISLPCSWYPCYIERHPKCFISSPANLTNKIEICNIIWLAPSSRMRMSMSMNMSMSMSMSMQELRTWIHDNLCNLTIKSDSGQHAQFFWCLSKFIKIITIISTF